MLGCIGMPGAHELFDRAAPAPCVLFEGAKFALVNAEPRQASANEFQTAAHVETVGH